MRITGVLTVLALLVAAPVALAATNAEIVKARQEHYKTIGKSFKGAMDELKKPDPSVPALQGYAKAIDDLAPQVPTWFPKGTGIGEGVKTAAKPEIWSKPQDFAKAANGLKVEAAAFYALSQKGDVAGMKAELPKLGGACKSCHDQFKAKDEQ